MARTQLRHCKTPAMRPIGAACCRLLTDMPCTALLLQLPPLEREWDRQEREKGPRLVRVQLNVHYRVHSRQMLCIGGSQVRCAHGFERRGKAPGFRTT